MAINAKAFGYILSALLTGISALFNPHAQSAAQPAQSSQNQIGDGAKSSIILENPENPLSTQTQNFQPFQLIQIPAAISPSTSSSSPASIPSTLPVALAFPPSPSAINAAIQSAVVNILCIAPANSTLKSISGSGVIIDPRGVVLTNAHIGQYFLLNQATCTIRTGDPAGNSKTGSSYQAELVYLPPEWIEDNSLDITGTDSLGTGQYDFSLLVITPATPASNSQKTPTVTFPYLTLAPEEEIAVPDQSVLVAGYPAEFLTGDEVENNLQSLETTASVQAVSSFDNSAYDSEDLISIDNSIVAQRGSSGGSVTDSLGNLLGIISTVTDSPTITDRTINAITIDYINRTLVAETGSDISSILAGDIYGKSAEFNQVMAPAMTTILLNSLNQTSLGL